MTDLRACFLGDSYVNGVGDDTGLGWVGRVVSAARRGGADLTVYNLGVRRETSVEVARRTAAELSPRLKHGERFAVVFSFGSNDLSQKLPLRETLAAARQALTSARAQGAAVFLVSPPVFLDQPAQDAAAQAMTRALAKVSLDRNAPFLDLRTAVPDWRLWWAQARAGDGAHPNGEGYALVADAFSAWAPWRGWLA